MTKKSTALATVEERYPALRHTGEQLSTMLQALDVTLYSLPQLRVPTGGSVAWNLRTLEGVTSESDIEGIILHVQGNLKKWWRVPFAEADTGTPPDCSSSDTLHGYGINTLDEDAKPEKHDCRECPWNQFGSKRGQGEGKDCADFMLVAFLREGKQLPDVLSVAPTSLKSMRGYFLDVFNEQGLLPTQVVTKLALTSTKRGNVDVSTIVPSFVRKLEGDDLDRVASASEAMKGFFAGQL